MSNKKQQRMQDQAVKNAKANVARRHAGPRPVSSPAPEATNVVDFAPASGVDSGLSRGDSKTFNSGEQKMTLTRTNVDRKGSSIVYSLGDGYRGTVKFARSVFGETIPSTLELTGDGFAAPGSKAKAKMTKEERAAARAAMTPADKARRAKEIADRATARAAKLAAAAGV
jgi:hypothetical protein